MVLVITPLVIFFAQYRGDDFSTSSRDPTLSVISLLPLIYVVLAAGVALTKHRCIDEHANPPRIASHVVLRAWSNSWYACRLFPFCVHRMRFVCLAAASGHPGLDELASQPPRGCAHIVVGTMERLRGQFRSKRACRRHALNLGTKRFIA